jgi:hypothetical protein
VVKEWTVEGGKPTAADTGITVTWGHVVRPGWRQEKKDNDGALTATAATHLLAASNKRSQVSAL